MTDDPWTWLESIGGSGIDVTIEPAKGREPWNNIMLFGFDHATNSEFMQYVSGARNRVVYGGSFFESLFGPKIC